MQDQQIKFSELDQKVERKPPILAAGGVSLQDIQLCPPASSAHSDRIFLAVVKVS